MPRQSRLDAPGILHHVIARGIERRPLFLDPADYQDFLHRLEGATERGRWTVLAWALIPNHFHLLVRTGPVPLAAMMRSLMTGYAQACNRRHGRHGHVFQNRYKSILCDEERYLLELVRYLGLNPLRAGVVADLEQLDRHPYSSHSALMGTIQRPWQAVDEILGQFGPKPDEARRRYREFVAAGIAQGHRPELVGGGLIRSAGGWAEVLSLRSRKAAMAADERILGDGAFVEATLQAAASQTRETLRLSQQRLSLPQLEARVAVAAGLEPGELRTAGRRLPLVEARRAFSQLAVRIHGYSGAEVARYLGVTTSCVNRAAGKPDLTALARSLHPLAPSDRSWRPPSGGPPAARH
ncbi:MAG: transposase [Thermodesulfobacteriota bacterium]